MTRKWTLLTALTLSIASLSAAETSDLRGTTGASIATATVAPSDPYASELLGGPILGAPRGADLPEHTLDQIEAFEATVEPVFYDTPTYESHTRPGEFVTVRYTPTETQTRAPEPARVQGLLTWQGRTN
jgi:hypothetical protein